MHLSITYTKKDFYNAQLLHFRTKKRVLLWVLRILGGVFLFVFLTPILAGVFIGDLISVGQFLPQALASFAISVWLLIFPYIWLRYLSAYMFKRANLKDVEFDFSEESIDAKQPSTTSSKTWDGVFDYVFNDKVLLLYCSQISFMIIPRRICDNKDWEELLSLVRRKIKKST